MARPRDKRPPIRDYIRRVLAERGHSMAEAERQMGIRQDALGGFMRETFLTMNEDKCQRLADYLDVPYEAVRRWIMRDYYRIVRRPETSLAVLEIEDRALTWWGEVGEPMEVPYSCKICPAAEDCHRAVNAGQPMPCERFLEKELVPAHALAQLEIGL